MSSQLRTSAFRAAWFAACAAIVLFGHSEPASAGLPLPNIKTVTFTGTPGNYTATLTGLNFGAAPGGIPCNACTPSQLQVVNLATQPALQTVNVTSWSDTTITVTGIAANDGDGIRFAVYNLLLGNVDAWGGHVVHQNKTAPKITTITPTGSGKSLTLTIAGSGFGAAPNSVVGNNIDTPFLVVSDWNANAPGTDGFPWNAGFCGAHDCNGVSIGYQSWTDTEIVVSGFGSSYASGAWISNPRDAICVGVWPSTSVSNGTTGGVTKCTRLPKK